VNGVRLGPAAVMRAAQTRSRLGSITVRPSILRARLSGYWRGESPRPGADAAIGAAGHWNAGRSRSIHGAPYQRFGVLGRIALTFKAARSAYQPHHNVGRRTRRGDKLVSAMIVA
jgi:hypothetical protein